MDPDIVSEPASFLGVKPFRNLSFVAFSKGRIAAVYIFTF